MLLLENLINGETYKTCRSNNTIHGEIEVGFSRVDLSWEYCKKEENEAWGRKFVCRLPERKKCLDIRENIHLYVQTQKTFGPTKDREDRSTSLSQDRWCALALLPCSSFFLSRSPPVDHLAALTAQHVSRRWVRPQETLGFAILDPLCLNTEDHSWPWQMRKCLKGHLVPKNTSEIIDGTTKKLARSPIQENKNLSLKCLRILISWRVIF